ncbi:hypothetical protein DL96DRAFT_1617777 [Flagelloscypha sp. PMI_526]|nr:hypothetical protein DL96DRAFT_1617777 [Flagelloscypha sp. PMI_526]
MVTISDTISRFLGCVLVVSGVLQHMYPVEGAHFFGITNANSQTAIFMPALGARNGALGFLVLSLSFTGQRKATGLFWLAIIIPALADARICWLYGEGWLNHAVGVPMLLILGCALLQG